MDISTFTKASDLHKKSEIARENDELQKSLDLIEEAIVEYENEENYEGLAKAYQSKVLSYKHSFLLTKEPKFREFAKEAADESLRIAERHDLKDIISSCYFRLGEVANLFEDFEAALENFKKAMDFYAGTNAEKGDYLYHLGEALYKSGRRLEGKETLLDGLKMIRENRNEVDEFLANVWESGAFMKLALLIKHDSLDEAKKYITQARKIVDSDPRLVIRKRQVEEAEKEIN